MKAPYGWQQPPISRTGDTETSLEVRVAELERLVHWLGSANKTLAAQVVSLATRRLSTGSVRAEDWSLMHSIIEAAEKIEVGS